MVQILSLATLAVALVSATDVLAHPHHRISKHHALARRASHPFKRAGTKAEACAARDAKRAKTSTSASGSASLTATATTSATSTHSPSPISKDDKADDDSKTQSTPPGLLSVLPPAGIRAGWTLAPADSADVKSLVLSDDLFDIVKEIKDLPHDVVTVDGKKAIHGHMEKGAVALNDSPRGGFSFYTPGPKDSKLDLSKAREVSFGYSVKFSKGYDFNKGGKLPGLYGGEDEDTAATCSGGRHDEGCFSCRFMFRAEGAGELYLYIPPSLNRDNLCGDDGYGECRDASSNGKTYGASIGTGLWDFEDGKWTALRQVVHLNTPGKRDGWVKVYINGSSTPILNVKELSFRGSAKSVFYGIQSQYFHGGHESDWASPKDQDAWFADWSLAITQYE
ncbi:hypothetical protein FS837_011212 [Tulasnella sp. UAMH 9824]|nr:hypothetical protein FS837_011212 [Tulasnella sp. UAMH 9824]